MQHACYLLLAAHYPLLTTCVPLPMPTAHYVLPSTYSSLPTTPYPLPTTHYTCYPQPITHYLLPTVTHYTPQVLEKCVVHHPDRVRLHLLLLTPALDSLLPRVEFPIPCTSEGGGRSHQERGGVRGGG